MKTIRWLLTNFGVLILFQLTKHFFGLKWAIGVSMVYAVGEILWLKLRKRPVSTFMLFSLTVVLLFGALDMWLANEFFLKLESGVMNLIIAGLFGLSLRREKTVIEELAEHQGRTSKERTPDKTFFFRVLTTIWFLYYLLRAFAFTWMSFTIGDDEAFIARNLLGTVSFYVLLAASLGLSQQLWNLLIKLRLMPSTRGTQMTETSTQRS
jgi:intracellular septation protein A